MNKLQVFSNAEFGKVRVIIRNDEPWFVAKDVAEVLGYTKLDSMYRNVDKEDLLKIDPQNAEFTGFPQNGGILEPNPNVRIMALINESGLYDAIFGSILPSAKKFKKWVTSEVLPSIRKYGLYAKDELLDDPDLLYDVVAKLKKEREEKLLLKEENNILQEQKELLIKENEDMKPKVEVYENVINSEGLYNFKQISSMVGVGRTKLFKLMRDCKILSSKDSNWNMPYSRYQKLFKAKVTIIKTDTGMRSIVTTLGTPKALKLIHKALKDNDMLHKAN